MSNYLSNHAVLILGSVALLTPILISVVLLIEIFKSRSKPFIKKGLKSSNT